MGTVDSKCLCLTICILWHVSKDFVRRYKNPLFIKSNCTVTMIKPDLQRRTQALGVRVSKYSAKVLCSKCRPPNQGFRSRLGFLSHLSSSATLDVESSGRAASIELAECKPCSKSSKHSIISSCCFILCTLLNPIQPTVQSNCRVH